MTAKRVDIELDDLINQYKAGVPVQTLSRSLGCSVAFIYQHLTAANVPRLGRRRAMTPEERTRRYAKMKLPLDANDIARRYLAGETKKAIAESLGVGQMTVHKRLRECGIMPAPNRSAAMKERLRRMSPAERSALASAAHDASRGRRYSFEELCRRATSRERTASVKFWGSSGEQIVGSWLRERVPNIVPQKAIGPYNVDFGASPIAVEVFGGNWHAYGKHFATLGDRTRYLFDQGWNLFIIWTQTRFRPLLPVVADDAAAFIQLSRRDPSFRRQYRVIWSDGEFISAGSGDVDDLALIPPGIRAKRLRAAD